MSICLSVITPTFNRRSLAERAIQSVLAQTNPLSFEIIVADDGSTDHTSSHLNSVFSAEVTTGKLKILSLEHAGDPGHMRNEAAARARGRFLAFLDSDDQWRPGRFSELAPLLSHQELILTCAPPLPTGPDWIAGFLRQNHSITSGAVIDRSLFEKLGGFPRGYYYGPPKSRRFWQGWEDYELWMYALLDLESRGALERCSVIDNSQITIEHQADGAGRTALRKQMSREAATLIRVSRRLPLRYWPLLAHRLAGAAKAIAIG